jgi:hypothetical protein
VAEDAVAGAGVLARAGVFPAGFGPRNLAQGAGFACGRTADRVPPGPALAGLAQDAWEAGLGRLNDDQLIGVMLAWRRLSSWAAAGELAAVAELDRRRHAQVAAGADPHVAEHVTDEIAAALTLTGVAADRLVELAARLGRLPKTRTALAGGLIDPRKAAVIAEETSALGAVEAAAAEHLILPDAAGQTTGQLRAAARRAVAFIDHAAQATRREQALKEARVEVWGEPSGTAALAGRDLPAASVLAASKNLTALAHQLKRHGMDGTIDQLRAHAYIALLLGQSPTGLLASTQPAGKTSATGAPPAAETPARPTAARPSGPASTGRSGPASTLPAGTGEPADAEPATPRGPVSAGPVSAGPVSAGPAGTGPTSAMPAGTGGLASVLPAGTAAPAGLGGSVNLTMPLATLLGSDEPGEVPGYGLVPAGDCRALATAMAAPPQPQAAHTAQTVHAAQSSHTVQSAESSPAGPATATAAGKTRWCLTLTSSNGQPLAHGCATARARPPTTTGGNGDHDWALTFTIRPLAIGGCDHQRESAGYQPAPALRHLITVRQRTCSFPGCRRPASRCDLDHTIAYEAGGRTCECNLAPLCRRHHRAKQARGWYLEQPQPGILIWTTPHQRTYTTRPAPYP